ncbi:cytochrome c oxidase assembly protein COX18, mitochondrial isoform X2 [Brevipalpus obovatus]|uniref:cytochrome c oxidase assembly protein COX18, mitochondrial isoform X2 n=1 Tax=Brevipalpus obovatus TaxID=246614 RepID=UPI003D9E244E
MALIRQVVFKYHRTPSLLFTGCQHYQHDQYHDGYQRGTQIRQDRRLSSIAEFGANTVNSIAHSLPVQKCTSTLIWFHDTTGCPWYMSLILSTIVFRTFIVFPFVIYNHVIDLKLKKIAPLLSDYVEKTRIEEKDAAKRGVRSNIQARARYMVKSKKFAQQIYIKHNVHPGQKFILFTIQAPLWVCMSLSVANLSWRPNTFVDPSIREAFSREGALWFSDLTTQDPYGILSLIFASLVIGPTMSGLILSKLLGIRLPKSTKIIRGSMIAWFSCVSIYSLYLPSLFYIGQHLLPWHWDTFF